MAQGQYMTQDNCMTQGKCIKQVRCMIQGKFMTQNTDDFPQNKLPHFKACKNERYQKIKDSKVL